MDVQNQSCFTARNAALTFLTLAAITTVALGVLALTQPNLPGINSFLTQFDTTSALILTISGFAALVFEALFVYLTHEKPQVQKLPDETDPPPNSLTQDHSEAAKLIWSVNGNSKELSDLTFDALQDLKEGELLKTAFSQAKGNDDKEGTLGYLKNHPEAILTLEAEHPVRKCLTDELITSCNFDQAISFLTHYHEQKLEAKPIVNRLKTLLPDTFQFMVDDTAYSLRLVLWKTTFAGKTITSQKEFTNHLLSLTENEIKLHLTSKEALKSFGEKVNLADSDKQEELDSYDSNLSYTYRQFLSFTPEMLYALFKDESGQKKHPFLDICTKPQIEVFIQSNTAKNLEDKDRTAFLKRVALGEYTDESWWNSMPTFSKIPSNVATYLANFWNKKETPEDPDKTLATSFIGLFDEKKDQVESLKETYPESSGQEQFLKLHEDVLFKRLKEGQKLESYHIPWLTASQLKKFTSKLLLEYAADFSTDQLEHLVKDQLLHVILKTQTPYKKKCLELYFQKQGTLSELFKSKHFDESKTIVLPWDWLINEKKELVKENISHLSLDKLHLTTVKKLREAGISFKESTGGNKNN